MTVLWHHPNAFPCPFPISSHVGVQAGLPLPDHINSLRARSKGKTLSVQQYVNAANQSTIDFGMKRDREDSLGLSRIYVRLDMNQ